MREGLRADVRYARRCCCVFQRVHSNSSSKQLCTSYICNRTACEGVCECVAAGGPMSPCLMNASVREQRHGRRDRLDRPGGDDGDYGSSIRRQSCFVWPLCDDGSVSKVLEGNGLAWLSG